MRAQGALWLLLAVIALVAAVARAAVPVNLRAVDDERATVAEERAKRKLAKLFDFVHYKQLFNKRYNSTPEELDRKRLFMASAMRAFVTGMKYKYRNESSYESVNFLSDYTQVELKRMENKAASEDWNRWTASLPTIREDEVLDGSEAPLAEFIPDRDEDVEAQLRKLIELHRDQPGFKELREAFELDAEAARRRVKREVGAEQQQPLPSPEVETELAEAAEEELEEVQRGPRELPELINTGAAAAVQERRAEIANRPASNNPRYTQIEAPSFGLYDQQVQPEWHDLPVSEEAHANFYNLYHEIDGLANNPEYRRRKKNGIMVDHRKCMTTPGFQGNCGACYAFASVAIMEWMYCKSKGKKVKFSEQYMIDCGNGQYGGAMQGCQGASSMSVAWFIRNFGLELEANYPYMQRLQTCPLDLNDDPKHFGYMRFKVNDAATVYVETWDKYLKHQPLYISVKTSHGFRGYGGGVYDGDCGQGATHAAVLAGHGREDGVDFWLIRNSYGTGWGEAGYFKLAKRASRRCLLTVAVAFGTNDGKTNRVEIKKTKKGSSSSGGGSSSWFRGG